MSKDICLTKLRILLNMKVSFSEEDGIILTEKLTYSLGCKYAFNYFDNGVTSFTDFASGFVCLLGLRAKPFIKSWYKGAHAFPGYGGEGYTDDADVDRFNMDDLDEPDFDRIGSVLSLGLNFAGSLIESGVSTFPDFADRMLSMLGERIQPYLKSLYEGIRWMPGFEKYNFSPTQEVDDFEIDSSEFDPEAFMAMTLPERFHAYMVREMCSEEDYQVMVSNNGYEYLPMLYRIKKEIPAEFYAYFHDLIHEEENEYFYNKFIQSLHGGV